MHNRRSHNINIVGCEHTYIGERIPNNWSEPIIGNIIRRQLIPPFIQEAIFHNVVSI